MLAIREVCYGVIAVGILVVIGTWVTKHPGFLDGDLALVLTEDDVDRIISVRRTLWLTEGDRLLTLTDGGNKSSSHLCVHDLDCVSHELTLELKNDMVASMSKSPDGRYVLVGTSRGRLWMRDLESVGSTLLDIFPEEITATAISHHGQLIAVAFRGGRILVCPTPLDVASIGSSRSYETLGEIDWPKSGAIVEQNLKTSSTCICFSENDERLLCAGNDGSLRLIDLQTAAIQSFDGCRGPVTAVRFLPGLNRIMSVGLDDTVRIWDIESGRELWSAQFGDYGLTTLAISPDGRKAAWGGFNGKIHVWNIVENKIEFTVATPTSTIWDLQFSPDGNLIAAATRERTLRIYDANTGVERHAIAMDVI
jgi:WD40 repeat protein